jgi:hypothetical protein
VDGAVERQLGMKTDMSGVHAALQSLYSKHRRRYRENPDSKQICCMWSTNDPPDILEGTEPICDIEEAFGIEISANEALKLVDMDLDQAARMILEIKKKKR